MLEPLKVDASNFRHDVETIWRTQLVSFNLLSSAINIYVHFCLTSNLRLHDLTALQKLGLAVTLLATFSGKVISK